METAGLAASVSRALPDLTRLSKSRCEQASGLRWPRRTRFSSSAEVIVRADEEEPRLLSDAGSEGAGLLSFRAPFRAGDDVRIDGPGEHTLGLLERTEQVRVANTVADHHHVDIALGRVGAFGHGPVHERGCNALCKRCKGAPEGANNANGFDHEPV